MHTGDTGGERRLEGTGARGNWRRTGATSLPGNKSAAKLQETAGGNISVPKTINSTASLYVVWAAYIFSFISNILFFIFFCIVKIFIAYFYSLEYF
jgi:hypothetical protein